MGCWSNMLDTCSNFEIFKTGAKLNHYILVILGLVFSVWTYELFVKVLDIRSDRRSVEYAYLFAFIQSYYVIYLTSAIGFLWGLHIKDFRYIKLWIGVKIFECAISFHNMLPCLTHFQYLGDTFFVCIVVLGFGVYITLSGWNLYKQLLQSEVTSNEQDTNSSLPPYVESGFPSVHRTNLNN